MAVACPKTHYDFMKVHAPEVSAKIEKWFYNKGNSVVHELPFGDLAPYASKEVDRRDASGAKRRKPTIGPKVDELRRLNAPTSEIVKLQKMATEEMFLLHVHEGARVSDEFEWMKSFNREGRKTFFFGDNLAAKLADTEVDVDSELLTLPFPSCMFVFEGDLVRDIFCGDGVEPFGGHWVASVYLKRSQGEEDGTHRILSISYLVTKKDFIIRKERNFISRPGETLEAAITGNGGANEQAYLEDAGALFARLVANSILYLSSSNPDVAPGVRNARDLDNMSTPKQKRAIIERMTSLEYTYVGGSSRPYVRAAAGEALRVSGKKRVRGHWKMQAHGANSALRKIIHIEPYWRGIDAAEAVDRAYRVR